MIWVLQGWLGGICLFIQLACIAIGIGWQWYHWVTVPAAAYLLVGAMVMGPRSQKLKRDEQAYNRQRSTNFLPRYADEDDDPYAFNDAYNFHADCGDR